LHYYSYSSGTEEDGEGGGTSGGEGGEGMELHVLTVKAFIQKGERFRPIFPTCNVSYIPVCLPAFRPDRCTREEDNCEEAAAVASGNDNGINVVTKKLRELHAGMTNVLVPITTTTTTATTTITKNEEAMKNDNDIL
jgi:hypothetical protein